jgi:nucleotide-binding universal stress UspA family protein
MEPTPRGSILASTDLSPESDDAVRAGAVLAADMVCPLIVWHASPAWSTFERIFRRRPPTSTDDRSMPAAWIYEAVREQVARVIGDTGTRVTVAVGAPGTDHVDLPEMAARTGAAMVVTSPGAEATRAIGRIPVPVLVARRSPRGPVVSATDFLAPSLAGLRHAVHEARRRNAALHHLYVLDSSINLLGDTSPAVAAATGLSKHSPAGSSARLDAADRTLQDQLYELGAEGKAVVVSGRADAAIVGYAESVEAALVVVGTHGCSPLTRMLLGSTAANVLERAPCSVLVVPFDLATQTALVGVPLRPLPRQVHGRSIAGY